MSDPNDLYTPQNVRAVLQYVAAHPGCSAREVAKKLFRANECRSGARLMVNQTLRICVLLGLLRTERAAPRHSCDAPYYAYFIGDASLAAGRSAA